MFNLIKMAKRKRGVSPVIAVVLLIALTVAAAAVIWAITSGLLGGVVSLQIQTTDTDGTGTTVTWTGTVESSEDGTVSFTLSNSTQSAVTGSITTPASGSGAVTSNSEVLFTVTFTVGGNNAGGSYTLSVTIDVDGEDTIETITITV